MATGIYTLDLLRPQNPPPERPQVNEPVSVHVLDGDETVLFGTGFESGIVPLLGFLDRLGGLDAVIVEHGDPDHYQALPSLVERYDPTVAIPAADAEALKAVSVEPDVTIEDGDERWGVRAIHVPGHTPGNTSFLHDESGTLLVGDTFVHHNSVVAAPGEWSGKFAPVTPRLNDDDAQALQNMAILASYEFDTARLTHGLNVPEGARGELDRLLADLESR